MTFAKLGGRERCKSAPQQRKSTGCSELRLLQRGMRTGDFEAGHAATFPGSAIHGLQHVGKSSMSLRTQFALVKMKTITLPIIKQHFSDIRYSLPLFYISLQQISHCFILLSPLLKWKLQEGRDFCFFCSLRTLAEPRTELGAYGCSIQFFKGMNLFCSHFRVIVRFRKSNVCKRAL